MTIAEARHVFETLASGKETAIKDADALKEWVTETYKANVRDATREFHGFDLPVMF
jgi:hypothetical protein